MVRCVVAYVFVALFSAEVTVEGLSLLFLLLAEPIILIVLSGGSEMSYCAGVCRRLFGFEAK